MFMFMYLLESTVGQFDLKNVSTARIRDDESFLFKSTSPKAEALRRKLLVEGLVSGPSHSFGYCSVALLESSSLSF